MYVSPIRIRVVTFLVNFTETISGHMYIFPYINSACESRDYKSEIRIPRWDSKMAFIV